MTSLSQIVRQFVERVPNVERILLGISGGCDSMVLLHATQQAQLNQPLMIVHVNHQISPNADEWQAFVERYCVSNQLPCRSIKVRVKSEGRGIEEAARAARYEAFAVEFKQDDLLLTAHHLGDQVETLFLRLARGSGIRGLSGIASIRGWQNGWIGRPLLNVSREELEAYAKAQGLQWVEDESNCQDVYDRNFLRLRVLPQLQQRWPHFATKSYEAMVHIQQANQLLGEYAKEDLQTCEPVKAIEGHSLLCEPLRRWTEERRANVLRYWLDFLGYRAPSSARLAEIQQLLEAKPDQSPLLNWGDCELRRYRERVYCLPVGWQAVWQALVQQSPVDFLSMDSSVPEYSLLGTQDVSDGKISLVWRSQLPGLLPGVYRLANRLTDTQSGRRGHPARRPHSQTLKKLFQEYGVEPWLRDLWPMLLSEDELAAVPGLWVEKTYSDWSDQAKAPILLTSSAIDSTTMVD